jgi:rhodanese-related sulfurtransferase
MRRPLRTMLVAFALVAGALAAMAGTPQPAIADDEIAAVDLAAWIRDPRTPLLVLDLRDEAEATDRVAGARRLAAVDAAVLDAASVVVVYSRGNMERSAVDTLRARFGDRRYLRLHGGIAAWNDEVLFPTIRDDAPARTQRAFSTRAELSRYFGGSPRRIAPGETATRNRSRRGC